MLVAAEGRKPYEFVWSRLDASAAVLYRRGETLHDSEVVLVREFRSCARTTDGFVRELPGDSCADEEAAAAVVAREEVEQETGLMVDPSRPLRGLAAGRWYVQRASRERVLLRVDHG